ncbi:MAG: lysoplasmalogenase [Myxococcota bacterium]
MPPLWWGAVAASLAYLVIVTRGLTGPVRGVKVLPALLLAGVLAPIAPLAAVGMAFSAAGDAFLLDKARFLLHGLAAFLVGHLLFVPAFIGASGQWPSPYVVGILVALATSVTLLVRPRSGVMRVAVPVYAVTLCAMAAAASTLGTLGLVGGVLFLASDLLLAVNQFKRPIPGRDLLVMSTYYGALLTLTAGLLAA